MTTTINTSENVITETPKKRGRRPIKDGGKSSPREIFCIAIAGDIHEKICVGPVGDEDPKSLVNDELEERARDAFKEQYGIEAETVYPPFHDRKGIVQASSKREVRPKIKPEDVVIIQTSKLTGEFAGWNVNVRLIENDPEVGMVFFVNQIDESAKKKAKPSSRPVFLSQIENLQEASVVEA